jgi:predicted CxxxxCH...CXXCH cytochrome family protein
MRRVYSDNNDMPASVAIPPGMPGGVFRRHCRHFLSGRGFSRSLKPGFLGGVIMALLIMSGCSKLEENSQRMNPLESHFHDIGWVNPSVLNNHGRVIAAEGYTMAECKSCHGADYLGGVTHTSCFSCHEKGPESCNTCHGSSTSIAPPEDLSGNTETTARGVGAHQKHLKAAVLSAGYHCATCHQPPKSFTDPVHINTEIEGTPVVFSDSLASIPSGEFNGRHTPNPLYTHTSATCADVYCHGSFEGGNQNNVVIWNGGNQAQCGSCHGDPVTGNPLPATEHVRGELIQNCQGCHFIQDSTGQRLAVAERLSNGTYKIDIPAVHVNGRLNLVGGEIEIGEKRIPR